MESNGHRSATTARAQPGCVLVVDDDPAIVGLFATTLALAGFETATATTGHAALDQLDESIVAVVLDNRLPDIAGTELLRRIREERGFTTLPVLLVTGDDQLAQRIAGLGAGATDYLVKPVEPDELVARVAAHVRAQSAWHEVVNRHLRQRAELVSSLFSIAPRASAEDTAAAICEHVLGSSELDGVAIASLDGGGRAVLLAARGGGPFAAALHQLTAASPDYLGARAEQPWIERLPDAIAPLTRLAVAPLRLGGVCVGLLALAAGTTTARASDQLLAEAIDYAGVATGLLGLSLHARSERVRRRHELDDIVRGRRFSPAFQPMVRLADGRVAGFEALTRFDDGARPDARFAEAARLGMGVDLELATMESAVAVAPRLPDAHFLSLNITAELVVEHGREVCGLLRGVERPVVLELTEHDPVDDYGALRAALDQVEPPVRVSVDDAGAGFASLRHVIMLRPDFVKLDRTWVEGIDEDATRQAMVAGLSHFARATGCALIAEGIERQAECETLAALDVALGQGFLLGRPAPAAA